MTFFISRLLTILDIFVFDHPVDSFMSSCSISPVFLMRSTTFFSSSESIWDIAFSFSNLFQLYPMTSPMIRIAAKAKGNRSEDEDPLVLYWTNIVYSSPSDNALDHSRNILLPSVEMETGLETRSPFS